MRILTFEADTKLNTYKNLLPLRNLALKHVDLVHTTEQLIKDALQLESYFKGKGKGFNYFPVKHLTARIEEDRRDFFANLRPIRVQ